MKAVCWPLAARMLVLGVFYFSAGELGQWWSTSKGIASPIWPAAGIACVGLLLFGRGTWPAIAIASFLVVRTTEWPVLAKLGISVGNTLEAMLAAANLHWLRHSRHWANGLRRTVIFLFAGALLPATVGASVAIVSVYLFVVNDRSADAWALFRSFWIGDVLGIMLLTPFVLAWRNALRERDLQGRWPRFVLCLVFTAACAWLVYFHDRFFLRHYYVYPALLWATIEFAQLGAVTTLAIVSVLGIWGTTLGLGPLSNVAEAHRIPLLQQFVGITAATMLVLAAVVRQRDENVQELASANRSLEEEIKDRLSVQSRLAANEKLFRATFEQAAVGIAQVALDGRVLRVNTRLCEITGHPRQELLKLTFQQITHADDLSRDIESVQSLLDGRAATYAMEKRYLRRDGSIVWISLSVSLVRDDGGKAQYFVSVIEDISERKQAEERLAVLQQNLAVMVEERTRQFEQANRDLKEEVALHQRTEQRLHEQKEILGNVLDNMTECVVVANADAKVILLNQAAQRLHGFPGNHDPVAWSQIQGVHPPDGTTLCPSIDQPLLKAIRGESLDDVELVLRPEHLEMPIRINLNGRALRDAAGRIQGGVVVYRDVTASRLAEEAIALSEKRLTLALENARLGMWDWDIATGDCYWNDLYGVMLGYEAGELPARIDSWRGTIHPEDSNRVETILRRHLESDDALYDVEYRARTKQGGWIWVNSRGRVQARDAAGRALRMMGTVQDISARKSSEDKILASLREKEVLLREIHHRVKNNLAIVSSLFYLQEGYAEDEETRRLLRECQGRIRSMALVHEFLYRSENLAAVNAKDYLTSLVKHLWDSHRSRDDSVRLSLEIEPITWNAEVAIPCGLIVNELITNCLKHAFPDGVRGVVQLRMSVVGDVDCVLRVTDDGIGMPEDLDPDRAQSLGLRLVRALTRQLEGNFQWSPKAPGTEAMLTFSLKEMEPSETRLAGTP